ncbi:C25 family cysteine peptidase [Foetidibacter luteolus]|uniref:putative type IX secretion system sortase PorU2 n=1 Tax=Foetidibacter luteolus TaxID=2608880 RepID=UPI00129B07EE|nr:C25 family cysteine peptidase [Foetidibacter luteolus]
MKKLWTIWCCLLFSALLNAQPYNNEWIDYSKVYYKFNVGETGLYRITQGTLAAAGLANTPAEQFSLWRNGQEIALFTSVGTGVLPANGYIEFWGEQNDGKPDRVLYKDPAFQLSDQLSLQTDTAAYFLTVNTAANNLRVVNASNNIGGNTLPAEPYFIHTWRRNFRTQVHSGKAVYFGENVYSSTYDRGEGLSSRDINHNNPLTENISSLFVASAGPAAVLSAGVAGSSVFGGNRQVQVRIGGTQYISQPLATFDAKIFANNAVPVSALSGASIQVTIANNNPANTNDRIVASFLEIQYPRQFNFGNAASFAFQLPASAQGNYLEISNFNSGGATPVLYDLSNNQRYQANTATTGLLKFALPPSSIERRLVLVSQAASNIKNVSSLTQRNFVDFANAANQGDYLIVSNKMLFGTVMQDYINYRGSQAGGSHKPKLYDIDELVDQFAFGIKKHPLSVKNFLNFARNKFAVAPAFAFLIGKAVTYDEYRMNESSRHADRLNMVPTFGWPASDNLLSSVNYAPVPTTPIGRLAVINAAELKVYLDKVKEYEQQQVNTQQTIENKAWMKNMVHVVGANDAFLDQRLTAHFRTYENILKDTFYGAKVYNFNKTATGPVTPVTNALMEQLFEEGISVLNYFGHSSATVLDYNLNDPGSYNNQGKYPVFVVNGCNAGNFYAFDTARETVISSLAEKYVLAKDRGAIAFVASTHFGVENYLDVYNFGFYNSLGRAGYGNYVSSNVSDAVKYLLSTSYLDSTSRYLHAEETVLHGDPALKINAHAKADYVVEEPQVQINPTFVSVADNSFNVKVYFYNIGKATGDSVHIDIRRQFPDGSSGTIISRNIAAVRYMDSVSIDVPIVASRDKGENKLIVTIDQPNVYDELSETNNTVTKTFFIYEDELRIVYPYNFSIVNRQNIKLVASTANPITPQRQYALEVDTTELFNSSAKVTKTVMAGGGIIEFEHGLSFRDSTVYYWRVAPVPASGDYRWNTSSFVYLAGSSFGYNQSHLYQHLKSTTDRVYIDSNSRRWLYEDRQSIFQIINSIYPTSGTYDADFSIQLNGLNVTSSACLGHSVIFNVFDPVSLRPLHNQAVPSVNGSGTYGRFMGSAAACSKTGAQYNFEFSYMDTASRRRMRDFMDWIPSGYLVSARLILDQPYDRTPFVDTWRNDQQVYGQGNSFYNRLKDAGFDKIDSFSYPRTWIFLYKKNVASFTPSQQLSNGLYDKILFSRQIASADTLGYIVSPRFGPAKAWKQVKWRGATLDATAGDRVSIDVTGITPSGSQNLLYTLNASQQDFDISTVDAATYPYLQLTMRNADSINLTPYQLRYWRLLYDPVPEGALAPNILYRFKDTLGLGETLDAAIAFKNVSDAAFADSIKVKLVAYDKNNNATAITASDLKRLTPGEVDTVKFTLPTTAFSGANTLFLDVNPENDQPEQYHFNNFMYKGFVVSEDNIKPLLDVTFDGVHILNNDIVSAKPNVLIKLKDESKFLLLDDTSLVTIHLQFPDGSTRRFNFNNDTLRFNAATPGSAENVASIEFNPHLLEDGQYILYVRGKDKTGNPAGMVEYSVSFQVYNKPMISNMFNYPNPFTTSTAFVFTVTGSQVPQNIRIQILTITGKIVKEITKDELGPLHIGRNITEYKWDGTDMYGQKLANGVYIYRVITNLDGKSLDKFTPLDESGNTINTDKYFNKGYGKMYLMR